VKKQSFNSQNKDPISQRQAQIARRNNSLLWSRRLMGLKSQLEWPGWPVVANQPTECYWLSVRKEPSFIQRLRTLQNSDKKVGLSLAGSFSTNGRAPFGGWHEAGKGSLSRDKRLNSSPAKGSPFYFTPSKGSKQRDQWFRPLGHTVLLHSSRACGARSVRSTSVRANFC
jgi:hypothetical protein